MSEGMTQESPIGAMPAHWAVKPFQAVVTPLGRKNLGLAETNLLSLSYGSIIRKDIEALEGLLPESFEGYQIVEKNDVVFRFTDLQNDQRSLRSGLVQERGIITSAYLAVRPRGLDPRFLAYLMRAYDQEKVFYSFGGGVRQSLKFDDVKRLPVPVPEVDEQRRIAVFLDRETAQIDALIAKQQQLISTLAERWQAELASVVALSYSSEMTSKLKYHAVIQTGLTLGKAVEAGAIELPYLRVANVQVGHVDLSEVKTVEVEPDAVRRHALRAGDVLMTEGGDLDKLGRGALWHAEIELCLHQNHVFAVRCRPTLDSLWLVYVLDAPAARQYFIRTAKKTTNLASTNSTVVGSLPIPCPSLETQLELVNRLGKAKARHEALVSKSKEVIQSLRERRQALISAAVTGNIDVGARS